MKRTKTLLGLAFVAVALLLAGCRDTPTEPEASLPSPETRNASDITEPVDTIPEDEHPALYYLIFNGEDTRFDEDDEPETILRALLEHDFAVQEAWYPITSSIEVPCMAPNVYPAFVVQLDTPNADIQELGFVSDPSPNIPNCGVEAFEYYRFD